MQRRELTLGLVGAALATATGSLRAQAWPDKPVRWLLSQPPGFGPGQCGPRSCGPACEGLGPGGGGRE